MGAGVKTDLGCDVPMSEVSCGESISAWLEAWRAAGANAAEAERGWRTRFFRRSAAAVGWARLVERQDLERESARGCRAA